MSDAVEASGRSRAADRVGALLASGSVRALGVYAASRLYSSLLLVGLLAVAAAAHLPFVGIRGRPDFFVLSGSWDGWFYRSIAEHGYPAALPLDAAGHVVPNEWAFLPVFPMLERAVVALTGISTFAAGTAIALLAGAGATLVLERLLRDRIGDRALRGVALFSFGPLAFVLQVAYAESLFLLLLFAAILAIQRGRYWTCLPFVLLAAFTRPGAVAIVAALALQLAAEWRATGRRPRRLRAGAVVVVVGAAASLAWSPFVDIVTGRHGGYIDTELSWWTGWVGRPPFVPFTPWFLITSRWLGPAGVVAAVLLAAALVTWIVRRSPRELGITVRAFGVMHVLYLAAIFLPQFSLPRLLMPLAPLLGASAFTATARRTRAWLLAAALLQPAGVVLLWFLSYP